MFQSFLRREATYMYMYILYLTCIPSLVCVVQVIAWTVLWWERREGVRSSGLFTIFWFCLVLYSALKMRSLILLSEDMVSFEHERCDEETYIV